MIARRWKKLSKTIKCDVCGVDATSNNPTRKMQLFYGKNVVNGSDQFYQQEVDVCLDCRNKLRDLTAHMEYEFVQDNKFVPIQNPVGPTETYEVVENPEGNPQEQGWYELVDEEYVLSSDTEVDVEKTYYQKVEVPGENPKELGWYEKVNIDYVLTEDEVVVDDKQYYVQKG